jgi:MOSC domain-containing protein YiiM
MTHPPRAHEGTVESINVSDGGVPKLPVERALVSADGLAGDRQRNLEHHGGEARALCIYSADLIDALRAEGHPIATGAAGENLTVRGIRWEAMTIGARIRAGEVEAEITAFANPCHNLRPCFVDGVFSRISEKVHPGWSRVYARVVRGGVVARGDAVAVFEPESPAG